MTWSKNQNNMKNNEVGDPRVATVRLTLIVPSTGKPTGRIVYAGLKIHEEEEQA